jgi:hypothetical protein
LEKGLVPEGLERGFPPCPAGMVAQGPWFLTRASLGPVSAANGEIFLGRAVLVRPLAVDFLEAVPSETLVFLRGLVGLAVGTDLSVFLLAGGSSLSFILGIVRVSFCTGWPATLSHV